MELQPPTAPLPPFFAAVRRRHPDVDIVLLPPEAPAAPGRAGRRRRGRPADPRPGRRRRGPAGADAGAGGGRRTAGRLRAGRRAPSSLGRACWPSRTTGSAALDAARDGARRTTAGSSPGPRAGSSRVLGRRDGLDAPARRTPASRGRADRGRLRPAAGRRRPGPRAGEALMEVVPARGRRDGPRRGTSSTSTSGRCRADRRRRHERVHRRVSRAPRPGSPAPGSGTRRRSATGRGPADGLRTTIADYLRPTGPSATTCSPSGPSSREIR